MYRRFLQRLVRGRILPARGENDRVMPGSRQRAGEAPRPDEADMRVFVLNDDADRHHARRGDSSALRGLSGSAVPPREHHALQQRQAQETHVAQDVVGHEPARERIRRGNNHHARCEICGEEDRSCPDGFEGLQRCFPERGAREPKPSGSERARDRGGQEHHEANHLDRLCVRLFLPVSVSSVRWRDVSTGRPRSTAWRTTPDRSSA